ncbi:hypothetical protein SNEBB_009037 [Seison nebaliae]|nr:hypothetical protein SNEBB_009037 [Seison nebaliae]
MRLLKTFKISHQEDKKTDNPSDDHTRLFDSNFPPNISSVVGVYCGQTKAINYSFCKIEEFNKWNKSKIMKMIRHLKTYYSADNWNQIIYEYFSQSTKLFDEIMNLTEKTKNYRYRRESLSKTKEVINSQTSQNHQVSGIDIFCALLVRHTPFINQIRCNMVKAIENDSKYFRIFLSIFGFIYCVELDDYMIFDKQVDSCPLSKNLWAALLLKCICKTQFSYDDAEDIHPFDIFAIIIDQAIIEFVTLDSMKSVNLLISTFFELEAVMFLIGFRRVRKITSISIEKQMLECDDCKHYFKNLIGCRLLVIIQPNSIIVHPDASILSDLILITNKLTSEPGIRRSKKISKCECPKPLTEILNEDNVNYRLSLCVEKNIQTSHTLDEKIESKETRDKSLKRKEYVRLNSIDFRLSSRNSDSSLSTEMDSGSPIDFTDYWTIFPDCDTMNNVNGSKIFWTESRSWLQLAKNQKFIRNDYRLSIDIDSLAVRIPFVISEDKVICRDNSRTLLFVSLTHMTKDVATKQMKPESQTKNLYMKLGFCVTKINDGILRYGKEKIVLDSIDLLHQNRASYVKSIFLEKGSYYLWPYYIPFCILPRMLNRERVEEIEFERSKLFIAEERKSITSNDLNLMIQLIVPSKRTMANMRNSSKNSLIGRSSLVDYQLEQRLTQLLNHLQEQMSLIDGAPKIWMPSPRIQAKFMMDKEIMTKIYFPNLENYITVQPEKKQIQFFLLSDTEKQDTNCVIS